MNKVKVTITLKINETASQVYKWFGEAIETELNEGEEVLEVSVTDLPEGGSVRQTAIDQFLSEVKVDEAFRGMTTAQVFETLLKENKE
jgi:hypothetical protein